MTADKSAAPPVEREKLTDEQIAAAMLCVDDPLAWGRLKGDGAMVRAFAREIERVVLASPPIPAGQTLSAQPVATPSDADRKLMEQAREALSKLKSDHWEHWHWQDIHMADAALGALRSRLDGANAGEKP